MTDQTDHQHQSAIEWRTELSGRVTVVESGLTELKSTTAAVVQSLADLGRGVDRLALDIRAERKPTQWGTLISLAALIVVIGGGFTTLTVQPLRDSIMSLDAKADSLREQAFLTAEFRGRADERDRSSQRERDGILQHMQEAEKDTLKMSENAAYQRGQIEGLSRWTQSIDTYGSRRWVEVKP